VVVGLAACTAIVDFGRVVAIDVVGPADPTLEEGDTLRLRAYGVSAAGDSVPDAVVTWQSVIPDSASEVLRIDSTGLITGITAGEGFVQALHRSLATPLISVTVTPRPDTVTADSTRFSATSGDTPLTVTVLAFPDTGVVLIALPDKTVHFVLVDPTGGSLLRLLAGDGTPGASSDSVTAVTGTAGTATALLQQIPGTTAPDSAVIEAIALTTRLDTVPGSPIRFVVTFP
jgi:hypothetical protein